MFKLARYLKRYMALLAVAIVLLFFQAILDLNLPKLMSDIVNTGIQRNGIEEIAPKAIPQEGLAMLSLFMSEQDAELVKSAYTEYNSLDANQQKAADAKFPKAASMNAFVLTADAEVANEAGNAIGRAGYAIAEFAQQMQKQQGGSTSPPENGESGFDMDTLQEMMPMLLQMPPGSFDDAIKTASAAPEILTQGIAGALNKSFYEQLGADIGKIQTAYILKTGGIMLLISFAVVSCAIGAGFCFAKLGAGVARDLRRDIFSKVTSFNNAEMDNFSTSSLITRTTNDVLQVQQMYSLALRMLIYAPIMGIGGVIMAIEKSSEISWIIGVAVALVMAVIFVLYVVVMPKFKKMQTLLDRLSQVARENLTGIMVIRAFGTQDFQKKRFEKANRDYTDNSLFVGRSMAVMFPIMMLIMNGIALMIVWLGAEQISKSNMQVGDMMAFIQYAMQIIMSFLFIAMIFVMVPRATVSAERINGVLKTENKVIETSTPVSMPENRTGTIVFDNVSFKYDGADENALSNISFTAKPGETTAIIGPTGSGKSTLISLIPRFYDTTEGKVTIDGINVRDLTQHDLRHNIGYVPQKGRLFRGTIADNLRFGNEHASDSLLREAAEVAQAAEFIDSSDDGFQTEISQGGANVSGGQRQRLAIARALVTKAPVYIFDDSFSALDFTTDAKLRAALKPYTKDSAVLLVAQRVSTIMQAEQIIVMDNGKIAGIGTHHQLLANCPTYREIAESQLSKEELA